MSRRPPCDRLLGWARSVLEPAVVTRVVEPCVADVRHEHAAHLDRGDRAAARRVELAGLVTVLGLVLRLRLARRVEAAGRVTWWALLPAVATALLATVGMAEARPGAARAQIVFVVAGVLGAALTATTSARTIRRASRLFVLGVPLALLGVLLVGGESEHAARRWFAIGPLHVHVAALATPAFVLGLSGLLTTRRPWLGAVFAAL